MPRSLSICIVENANCTRETKTSNSCTDAVYSNVKIDLKMLPTKLTDQLVHALFGFSELKLNHLAKEKVDDRMIKFWIKINDVNAIINLQFYMQHELEKLELSLDPLNCAEAIKIFQLLLNKCVEKCSSEKLYRYKK